MALDQNENILEIDEELLDALHQLIAIRDGNALRALLIDLHAADIAHLLQFLDEDDRHYILELLHAEDIGEVMLHLPEEQREGYLAELEPQRISDIVEEMSPDDAADIVSGLEESVAAEVLQTLELSDQEATEEIRDLLRYDEDTAGGRMTTDYVSVNRDDTVATAIERVREFVQETELDVYVVYVVDAEHKLRGIIRLQDLVLRHPNTRVSAFMLTDIVSVAPYEDQAVVAQVMQRYDLVAVPVIADDDELLGVVTFDDIADIIEEESSEDMLYLAGVTDEETSTTSPLLSVRRRLPWLAINLGNAFITSMVVSQFQGTIGRVTALAALMPLVGGMGGNAAIQSITVMVRSIALGDVGAGGAGRAVTKEMLIGLMNGLAMGILAGTIVALMWHSVQLGLLIAAAMQANLFVAGLAGAVVPILLRKLNFDPALSSGPLVTNLTDVTGYLVFLGLATVTVEWLLG